MLRATRTNQFEKDYKLARKRGKNIAHLENVVDLLANTVRIITMNLETIKQYRNDIINIAREYKADNIRVFGSVARGEATEKSDLDILIHTKQGCSLLDICKMENRLSDLLGIKVEIVTDEGIREELAPYILSEAIPI